MPTLNRKWFIIAIFTVIPKHLYSNHLKQNSVIDCEYAEQRNKMTKHNDKAIKEYLLKKHFNVIF